MCRDLYISDMYVFTCVKGNLISLTPTAPLGFHYRILVVALCNADFIPRCPSLRFICILVVGLCEGKK
jgi:hypothetical protein